MSDARLERNWRLANAASPNVTKPSSKAYRDNYGWIFRKKPKRKTEPNKK